MDLFDHMQPSWGNGWIAWCFYVQQQPPAPWNSLASAFLLSEAPVWGQVRGWGRRGGGSPGEAAAQPDVGGHQSHPISPRRPAGGSHEGKTWGWTNPLFWPPVLIQDPKRLDSVSFLLFYTVIVICFCPLCAGPAVYHLLTKLWH